MKLFLLSGSEDGRVVLDVRFGDVPDPDAGVPVDLSLFADAAHERIRERYPSFTYEFARTTGLLDIPGWRRIVAAYWLVPFSERSPMRTGLIEHLYHLTLVGLAVEKHGPRELRVATDDDKLWCAIARLATAHGAAVLRSASPQTFVSRAVPTARSGWLRRATETALRAHRLCTGIWRIVRARARLFAEAWSKRRLFRDQASEVMATRERKPGDLAAFYTRYPVLWEIVDGHPSRDRNFGTFPDYLARRGFDVVYPGVFSSGVVGLPPTLSAVRAEARERGIVFLDALVSVGELLRVYLAVGHVVRYLLWRARLGRRAILFGDIDVRELVLRELDAEFLYGTELLTNCMRAYGFQRFCRRYRPRVIFHPFEYQPMERALYAGANAGLSQTVVVGLQTGMFSSNRLAWFYAEGEISIPGVIPAHHRSPFPDYLAVYGTLAYATLSRQCPPDRVLLVGPIRYPEIRQEATAPCSRPHGLDSPSEVRILVAGTINKDETIRLLRASAKLARARPEIFLLIKFHYHNPMQSEWARLAEASGCTSFRVCDTKLTTLLEESRAVLLGWSSTGVVVEAITAGCAPVVLRPPDHYSYGTSVDIGDAIFLCDDEPAIGDAVNQCIDHTPTYWERRRAWPEALEKMAFPLDGRQDERLLAQLRERGVL